MARIPECPLLLANRSKYPAADSWLYGKGVFSNGIGLVLDNMHSPTVQISLVHVAPLRKGAKGSPNSSADSPLAVANESTSIKLARILLLG